MSNYKTKLQSNNADLQSIVNQIDELGAIVSEQDTTISQIKSALRGSGGTTVDDIGVFTLSHDGMPLNISFLFIKGMTFKEFCSSKMNKIVYDDGGLCGDLYNGKTYIDFSTEGSNLGSFYGNISADGLIECTENTVIEETNYQLINGLL